MWAKAGFSAAPPRLLEIPAVHSFEPAGSVCRPKAPARRSKGSGGEPGASKQRSQTSCCFSGSRNRQRYFIPSQHSTEQRELMLPQAHEAEPGRANTVWWDWESVQVASCNPSCLGGGGRDVHATEHCWARPREEPLPSTPIQQPKPRLQ